MVRIIDVGVERKKEYFKCKCPYCSTIMAFELDDIWFEPEGSRITCPNPKCKQKVFLDIIPERTLIYDISQEEYDNAQRDTSKSGLQILMDEKKAADSCISVPC